MKGWNSHRLLNRMWLCGRDNVDVDKQHDKVNGTPQRRGFIMIV